MAKRGKDTQKNRIKEGFLSLFRAGETALEKNLSASLFVSLPFAIVALTYWAINRTYNKWLMLVFLSLLVFIGTFGLRVFLIEKKDEIENLTPEEARGMGLSLNEAKEYERKQIEVKLFRQWLALIILTLLLGVIFILWWPV